MPKIKIVRLPKRATGGPTDPCPEGYTYDAQQGTCVGKDGCPYGFAKNQRGECVPAYTAGANTAPNVNETNVISTDTQQSISDGCAPGFARNARGECVPAYTMGKDSSLANTETGMGPFPDNIGGTGVAGLTTTTTTKAPNRKNDSFLKFDAALTNLTTYIKNKKTQKDFNKQMFRKSFEQPVVAGYRGNVETNTGVQWPNQLTPPNEGMFISQFGGSYMGQGFNNEDRPLKIKILSGPQEMKYGGQSSYGLDLGWKIGYTDMNKTSTDYYTNSISEDRNPKSPYVLEAEGGETIYKPGDGTIHNISGDSHAEGGVKMTEDQVASRQQPDLPSFIFSKTASMRIKDKKVLAHFGFNKPATPAEISKKFDLNKFKAIIESRDTDEVDKNTALLMKDKNEKKLAELSMYQEVVLNKRKPPQFAVQKLSEQQEQPRAKFGGAFIPEYNAYLPEYQPGGTTPPKHGERRLNPNSPGDTQVYDGYNNVWIADADWLAKYKNTPAPGPSGGSLGGFKLKANLPGNIDYNEIAAGYNVGFWDSKENYKKNWIPKVDKAFSDPAQAKILIDRIENYSGQDADDVKAALKKAKTFEEKVKIAKNFGKDMRIGPYHAILADAIDSIPPPITIKNTVPDVDVDLKTTPPGKKEERQMGFVCIPTGDGKTKIVSAIGGYKTEEEAKQNCGSKAAPPPYGYLAPDLANMYATAAVPPKKYLPFIPNPSFTSGQLPLEDWRARTASRFSTQFAAPAQILANYTGPQGLASNLSKLSGDAAQAMASQDMAPIIGSNVRSARDFFNKEALREDAYKAQINKNAIDRWKGNVIANQQYDNALRAYLSDNTKAFTRGWKNRMMLGDINDTNVHFFKDPKSGRNIFRGNFTGVEGLGTESGTGYSGADLASAYNTYFSSFYEDMKNNPNLSDKERKEEARALARMAIQNARETQTYDQYGNPKSRKSTGFDFDS